VAISGKVLFRKQMSASVRVVCLALALASGSVCAAEMRSVDSLIDAVVARLALMDEVAAWKWRSGRPIEDLAREREVIESAMRDAGRVGLDPGSTSNFFRQQIEAAKDVQRLWQTRWAEGSEHAPDELRDLETDLRPAIGGLGRDIARLLAIELPALPEQIPPRLLNETETLGISPRRAHSLYEAARRVRYAPIEEGILADYIRARGVLRVGTTGDYPPFSFRDEHAQWRGIDIDIAKRLAAALGVEPHWVQTSWPTLTADMVDRRYDIAMSGVSRTTLREQTGLFSRPYHEGGKTPIARCDRADRFPDLESVDRPGVRVIVNPGGTNERFVRANITHADIITHTDNTTIFEALIDRRADVMITDTIEVRLQIGRHDELCATMVGRTLNRTVKAYWMPKDPAFQQYVDAFIDELNATGELDAIFSLYLPVRSARAAPEPR
jgi:cyclohexadienyl dehydratase